MAGIHESQLAVSRGAGEAGGLERTARNIERGTLEEKRKAAERFEAMFINRMLQQMRKGIPDGGLIPRSHGQKTYEAMLDENYADKMAQGGGIGIADMLMREWVTTPTLKGRRFSSPVDLTAVEGGRISSEFGLRHDPIDGEHREHHGLDLAVPEGTPVRAAAPGVVSFVGERGGYGQLVIVDHGSGIESRYAHNASIDVTVGQRVERGQQLSLSGQTGRSTGPHLHFELRQDGEALDPAPFIRGASGSENTR